MNAKKMFFMLTAVLLTAQLFLFCGEKKDPAALDEQQENVLAAAKNFLGEQGAPYAVGIGESTDEPIARSMAIDNARAELAKVIAGDNPHAIVNLKGSYVYESITKHNPKTNVYRIYSLVTISPEAADDAELAIKKEDMMKLLDETIAETEAANASSDESGGE